RLQRAVPDRLDKAIAEGIERGSKRGNRLRGRDPLYYCRGNRAVIDQGPSGRVHELPEPVLVTGPELIYLADAAGNWILVAFGARLCVVAWAEAVRDLLATLKLLPCVGKGVDCGCVAVEQIIDKRVHLSRRGLSCGLSLY